MVDVPKFKSLCILKKKNSISFVMVDVLSHHLHLQELVDQLYSCDLVMTYFQWLPNILIHSSFLS